MIAVTVIVPVKNEEINISACLDLLTDFSQVIIIDSGSTDRTCAVAAGYENVTVVQFCWNGQFPKKRNWALQNCSIDNEWILFLDADEFISDKFKLQLQTILTQTKCNGFWLTYDNYFLGKCLRFGDKFRKLALMRKGYGQYERIAENQWSKLDMEVHEHLLVDGAVGEISAPVKHRDFKGLDKYIDRHNQYSSWEANLYYSVKKDQTIWSALTFRRKMKYTLLSSRFSGIMYFLYTYIYKLGFLDGTIGFIFAFTKMTYYFQVYSKIKEKALDSQL